MESKSFFFFRDSAGFAMNLFKGWFCRKSQWFLDDPLSHVLFLDMDCKLCGFVDALISMDM